MFQKYGSDPTRNLMVDRVESSAAAHLKAVEELRVHDYKGETNDLVNTIRQAEGF